MNDKDVDVGRWKSAGSRMIDARIWRIPDYADLRPIESAIVAALAEQPHILKILGNASRPPLVVVKPNWVQESHEYAPDVWEPVITHPCVLLAAIEAIARHTTAGGTIVVCDAPHTYASFEAITARGDFLSRFQALSARHPQLTFELIDLRREVWIRKEEVTVQRRTNPHDPRGYVRLDLGRDSLFYRGRGENRYYGADYDSRVVNEHHRGELQEYLLAGTPLACDLFVNVPKLKTHKKTGITCCLKNLVGINGDKNWLPHHTEGSPRTGGDEFPAEGWPQRLERTLKHAGRAVMLRVPALGNWMYRKMRNTGKAVLGDSEQTVRNGNWHGNDTCWRMALDLNRALLFGNSDGTWREAAHPKAYFAIVDGILGGEGNGPLCPDPVASGVIVTGANPATVDAVAARLMGFDPDQLPIVREAFQRHRWPIGHGTLSDVTVFDGRLERELSLPGVAAAVPGGFKPHFGWQQLNPTSCCLGLTA
jgi:uncharacterized protein (DUF362 family)